MLIVMHGIHLVLSNRILVAVRSYHARIFQHQDGYIRMLIVIYGHQNVLLIVQKTLVLRLAQLQPQ